jgi:integrase
MATIRKNGSNWQAIVRKKGFKNQSKSFPLKRDAQAWANVTESEMVRGTFVDTATASNLAFAECLDRYEEEQTQAGRRSLKQLKSQLNIIRRSDLVKLSLANVAPADIVKFQKERMATGIKTATYIKDHNLLHALFEVIRKDWAITLPKGNPVKDVRVPKHTSPTSRNRRLNEGEELKLLTELRKSSYQTGIIVKLALATGMRRGEIMNIRFGDVSGRAANSTLTIPVTKTDHPRVIPLTSEAYAALGLQFILLREQYGTMNGVSRKEIDAIHMFDVSPDYVTKAFAKACKTVGIEGLTYHDLRHEALSRMFEAGLDMMEVSHISGHRSFEMLKRYTHLKPQDLLDKLQSKA